MARATIFIQGKVLILAIKSLHTTSNKTKGYEELVLRTLKSSLHNEIEAVQEKRKV